MKRLLLHGAGEGAHTVSGAPFHYVVQVLRAQVGEAFEVFDGAGTVFDAKVTQVEATSATLSLGPGRPRPAGREFIVVQGLPKGDKLELVLQKGTELGATAFLPAACERSIVKLEGKEAKKLERWQRIVEEAARQSRRADVPRVLESCPLKQALAALPAGTAVFVLDEEERAVPLGQAFASVPPGVPVAIVIGPEGGLTREEVQGLVAQGARGVTLGALVLRTETAALAALSVLRHLDGVLG
jgi:16S rRNA (uracil1498-N3)-methyltransferase